mmetsp:Transcript_32808/g.96718  ORF Transcript_32808/g.96718 Transcript_32808/m.96718 type:complete len:211 (-) Transcript_32808:5751-6383(-)
MKRCKRPRSDNATILARIESIDDVRPCVASSLSRVSSLIGKDERRSTASRNGPLISSLISALESSRSGISSADTMSGSCARIARTVIPHCFEDALDGFEEGGLFSPKFLASLRSKSTTSHVPFPVSILVTTPAMASRRQRPVTTASLPTTRGAAEIAEAPPKFEFLLKGEFGDKAAAVGGFRRMKDPSDTLPGRPPKNTRRPALRSLSSP